jgi:hypothetical protein
LLLEQVLVQIVAARTSIGVPGCIDESMCQSQVQQKSLWLLKHLAPYLQADFFLMATSFSSHKHTKHKQAGFHAALPAIFLQHERYLKLAGIMLCT